MYRKFLLFFILCLYVSYSNAIGPAQAPPTPISITVPTTTVETGQYTVRWQDGGGSGSLLSKYTLDLSAGASTSYIKLQEKINSGSWTELLVGINANSRTFSNKPDGSYQYRVASCYNVFTCSSYKTSTVVIVQLPTPTPDFAKTTLGQIPKNASGFSDTAPTISSTLGAISGSGGVSGGSANYSVPIAVPPGRNNMQPAVQLSYSSSQGNGLLGVGWAISTGSAISRCGMTAAHDGVSKSVQYSVTNDKLCFNGQRLLSLSTYGQAGSEYRTELDSFVRIKQYGGNINSTATYFIVEHKNGLVETYGNTADAKHSAYGRSETLSWAISKKEDRASNNIKYNYYQPQANSGEHLLRYIKYTGHNGNDGNRLITYNYNDRNQFSSSYLAGGLTRKTKRLTSIITSVNGTVVRKYTLNYNTKSLASGRSLLRNVQECGYKSGVQKCLPATVFEWHEKAPEFVFEKLQYTENNHSVDILQNKRWLHDVLPHGDANGDGVRDFPGIYINAEGEKTGTHNENLSTCFKLANAFISSCLEIDFNGDGLTDGFRQHNNKLEIKYKNTNTWINTGIAWPQQTSTAQLGEILGFSDFNGDGFPDIAMKQRLLGENSKLWIFFNTKSLVAPFSNSNKQLIREYPNLGLVQNYGVGDLYSDSISIQLHGDLDGNGTSDFIEFDSGPALRTQAPGLPLPEKMLLINPNGSTFSITEKALTGRIPSYNYNGNLFHDINGDGLADWLSMSESSSALVYRLNTGGSFESTWKSLGFSLPTRQGLYELDSGEPEPYYYPIMSRFTVMDYNSDGVQDLVLGSTIVASSCAKILDHFGSNWKCDDDLYTGFTKGFTGSKVDATETPINSDIVDDSIRKYNAVKFVQALNGNISVDIEETDILASSTQRSVIDVTGDGLPDVITTFGCRFGECEWNNETSNRSGTVQNSSLQAGVYINRNLGSASGIGDDRFGAQDILKAVVNGLGKRDEWIYKPLSSDAYNTSYSAFYEAEHAATSTDRDYFNFASSMNVVAEHKVSNGIGGENSTLYRYRGAMYNNKGRGFQGFKSIIVEQNNFENSSNEAHRDTISRTDFTQKWPFSGIVQQSCTWLAANTSLANNDNEACVGVISKTLTNSTVNKATSGGARFVAIDSSTSIRYDLHSAAEISRQSVDKTFDNDGNATLVTQVNADNYGNFSNSVATDFNIDRSAWWLNKFNSITTTKSVSGTQTTNTESSSVLDKVTTVIPNTWHTGLRKPRKITTSGDGVNFSVETIYNNYGLPSAVTQSGEVKEGLSDTQKTQLRTTNFTYTNLGNTSSGDGYFPYTVTTSSGATNLITTSKYNPNYGLPTQITKADGTTTVNSYDNFGRLESSKQTGYPTKYLRYYANDSHAPLHSAYRMVSMSAGTPIQSVYVDMLGRTLRTAVASFNNGMIYQDKHFDRIGMTTVENGAHYSTSSYKPTVTYENYDALGRPESKSTLQANGTTLDANYDYVGLSTNINANGLNMSRTYNSLNMLVATTDANTGNTYYAYDAGRNPITIEDANGSLIQARYDALGRKLYVNDPNQGKTTFSYNDFGEVEKEIDANNDIIRYDMDLLGRVVKRYDYGSVNGASGKNNVTSTFTWDTVKKGLLTSEQSSGSKKTYQYDSAARLTVTTSQLDTYSYQTTAYYDINYGRPTGIKYPNNLLVAYDYKSNGYLEKEYNFVSGYIYKKVTNQDAFGNITAALVNNNATENTNMYSQISGQMLSTKAHVNGQLIHDITYDRFDSFGNIVEQNNNIHHSKEVFDYDDLHRLTSSTKTIGITSATINYDYDAVGNITQKSDYSNSYYYNETGNAGPNAVTSVVKVNGAGTATFAYDNKGNLVTGDGKTLYYNVHNKPTKLTKGGSSSQLYYGASLDRYKQVVISGRFSNRTTYYVDKLYEVQINNGKVKWRAYIGDTAIISHDDIDEHQIHFTHRDRLGSATTFSDHNGGVTAYRGYDPFGKPLGGDWSNLLPATLTNNPYDSDMPTYRGFTDHEHLDEMELIHMNGRVYDYNLGRFMSVDPFIQAPGNSQSMNPYSYIMNNPLSGTDPTGYIGQASRLDTSSGSVSMGSGTAESQDLEYNNAVALYKGIQKHNGAQNKQPSKNEEPKATTELKSGNNTESSTSENQSIQRIPYGDSQTFVIDPNNQTATLIDSDGNVVSSTNRDDPNYAGQQMVENWIMTGLTALLPRMLKTMSIRGNASGLIGKDFENYLTKKLGGNGGFMIGGRDFDGGVGNTWWEAKSGQYWDMIMSKPKLLEKFKSDMGARLRIATDNDKIYQLHSNTPIPKPVQGWLDKKGITYFEHLD